MKPGSAACNLGTVQLEKGRLWLQPFKALLRSFAKRPSPEEWVRAVDVRSGFVSEPEEPRITVL